MRGALAKAADTNRFELGATFGGREMRSNRGSHPARPEPAWLLGAPRGVQRPAAGGAAGKRKHNQQQKRSQQTRPRKGPSLNRPAQQQAQPAANANPATDSQPNPAKNKRQRSEGTKETATTTTQGWAELG